MTSNAPSREAPDTEQAPVKPVTMQDDSGFEYEVYHAPDFDRVVAERDEARALVRRLQEQIHPMTPMCNIGMPYGD